ncbi:sensor histidine kinase [Frankia sp. CNm7]|uniref:Sensor histidine kinase n=1 Tax=Frankia nepalensis TaxID=1836974 RepID=A0A937RF43_9ACTN|nr:sensor histidine kinase [Frankia nepalensis]MBL7498437.1 sensor histidine kinase [Frankia nepalensis]MBL7512191.1 sensor histidine kinase [Frankia nepalensis]MBL7519478.1 sensor histidine kinase [Frankia nepalensis]MBL7629270.1 sensor histidine kinase [Frankia nepalensis]
MTDPAGPRLPSSRRLTHQALIYGSDEEFLAATVPFCLDGVDQGDSLLVITTAGNTDLLREALRDAVNKVEFLASEEWYGTPGSALGACHRVVDQQVAVGEHRRMRVIGEPLWHGRDAVETAEWTRYESAINLAFAACPAWMICPYDTRLVPEAVIADARRTHPELAVGASTRSSPDYVDPAATTGFWERRIAPLPADGDGDAAVLDFDADLAAVRVFVARTAAALGVSPDGVGRLVFSVNEIATNALQHGGAGRLTMRLAGRRLVCDVANPSRRATDWFLGYRPPGPGQERGYGLWAVRQLCRLVEIDTSDGVTTVRLHVDLD